MLKLSSKRTHNLMDAPPPCTPHRIRFLSSPVKRVRPTNEEIGTSGSSSMETVAAADAPSPPASPPSSSGSTSTSGTPFSFNFSSPGPSTSGSSSPFAFPFPPPTNTTSTSTSSSSSSAATPFSFSFPRAASSSPAESTSGSSSSQATPPLSGRKHHRGEPRFVPKSRFDPNDVIRFAPRKKLRKLAEGEKGPLFTLEEVKALVAQVVAQREATIREEFERTLENCLQDQFSQFSQFNRDFVDRQVAEGECTYLN